MMFNLRFFFLLFALTGLCVAPARAFDCARASGMAEHAVCASPQLKWLDSIYNDDFYDRVYLDPQHAQQLIPHMHHEKDACISESCLRTAYLFTLAQLHGTRKDFNWQGSWWNTSAAAGNSGELRIDRLSQWGFRMDATLSAGIYRTALSAEVRQYAGVGFSDHIAWGADCAIVLIPLSDGKIKVRSDSDNSCKLLMPPGLAIDGVYVNADSDPRPPATLLSLGVLPDARTDEKFRQLVGEDYQHYVETASAFSRENDLDNLGASVVTMWMKGRADRQAAIVMTTPAGKIWALRIAPGPDGTLARHYATTEQDKKPLPSTLANWLARFTLP